MLAKIVLLIVPFVLIAVLVWTGGTVNPAYVVPPRQAGGSGGIELPAELDGWQLNGGEWFDAQRMFEKIDGKAPLYIDFGARGLYAGSFERDGDAWDMYLYAMADPGGAEGVFIRERSGQVEPADVGVDSYASSGSLVLHAGPYYIQLGALAAKADIEEAKDLARSILDNLPGVSGEAEAEKPALPREGQLAGTLDVAPQDAFGFSSLHGVRAAQYVDNGTTATWYTAEGGKETVQAYGDELRTYGAEDVFEDDHGVGGKFLGMWEYLGATPDGLYGVRDAVDRATLTQHWQTFAGIEAQQQTDE
jgi:hypothetical protein